MIELLETLKEAAGVASAYVGVLAGLKKALAKKNLASET
jgi:hypothetical protein